MTTKPLNDAPTRNELIDFLEGISTIDGVSFGERHPVHAGLFWWRKFLTILDRANTPDSAAQGAMGRLLAGDGDLYQLLMNVANGIDSPASCSLARKALIKIDNIHAQPTDATAQQMYQIEDCGCDGKERFRIYDQGGNGICYAQNREQAENVVSLLANTAQGKPCHKFQFNPEHWDHCDFCKYSRSDHALAAKKGGHHGRD